MQLSAFLSTTSLLLSHFGQHHLIGFFDYIANTLIEPGIALNIVDEIETAILSLDTTYTNKVGSCGKT